MSPTTTPAANAHRLSASTGSRFRDDRGSMTVLAAMFMIVIVLIVAALIDGEAIRATRRHAGDVAQEAARAAAQQVDTDARFSSSPTITIDVADATAAGTAVLNRAGASSGTKPEPTCWGLAASPQHEQQAQKGRHRSMADNELPNRSIRNVLERLSYGLLIFIIVGVPPLLLTRVGLNKLNPDIAWGALQNRLLAGDVPVELITAVFMS